MKFRYRFLRQENAVTEIKFCKDNFGSEDSDNEKSDWINHFLRPQTEEMPEGHELRHGKCCFS